MRTTSISTFMEAKKEPEQGKVEDTKAKPEDKKHKKPKEPKPKKAKPEKKEQAKQPKKEKVASRFIQRIVEARCANLQ